MKLANYDGRAALVIGDAVADLATVSEGRFGPDLASVYEQWSDVVAFAQTVRDGTSQLDETKLGKPVDPRQVFGIALNYQEHADEAGMTIPEIPSTFTKFPACLTGPFDDVALSGETVDWEAEVVAVIGRRAHDVAESDAWAYVAGLSVGQDVSDRTVQFAAGRQFSLGKSFPGYGPIGPWVVTPDEFDDPDDLGVGCSLDGEKVQDGRSNDMVLSVPRLVAELSGIVPLLPGDVIFTGTPSGVGNFRKPPRYLQDGNVLETWVEAVGTIRNRFLKK